MLHKVISILRTRILIERRRLLEFYARRFLHSKRVLWAELQEYLKKTESTGCSYTDYWYLYRNIRQYKPKQVLECGTGVSTLVIAFALLENEADGHKLGFITSMEEHEQWLQMAQSLLPEKYTDLVELKLSGVCEDSFSLFRGVRYADIPERQYDFVFVDGPKYRSPIDGEVTFDFDLIHVLRNSEIPVRGLVDKRVSTCFVLQQVLGMKNVVYSPVSHMGFIGECSKDDLCGIDKKTPSSSFSGSYRALLKTKLSFHCFRSSNN